jgi:hypothetical protein
MPDERNVAASNGSVTRAASSFERCWLEAKGRPPSPEETRTILTFNRLAKDAELDPLTMLLIVGSGAMGDKERAALFEQLDRIESIASAAPIAPPAIVPKELTAHLERIEERLDRTATKDEIDSLRHTIKATTTAAWWPPVTNELLAFAFGGAFVAILFCVILMAKISPTPLAFIGTVIATVLLAAVVMWAVSWWRARKLGY